MKTITMRNFPFFFGVLLGTMLFSSVSFGQPGLITRIGGNGTYGFSGDGGSARLAEISPTSICVSKTTGDVYFGESFGHRIRKIEAATGIITTICGTGIPGYSGDGGPAVLAQIGGSGVYYNLAMCLDIDDNLIFADNNNSAIRKIDKLTGIITTLNGPPSGPGYIISTNVYWLNEVACMCSDKWGNIYYATTWGMVYEFYISGGLSTIAGGSSLYYGYVGDGGPASDASLIYIRSITADTLGNVYFVTGVENSRIRKVNTSGIISTVAGNGIYGTGSDGISATTVSVPEMYSISSDPSGNIYYPDVLFGTIRRIDANTNILTTVAGTYVPHDISGYNDSTGIPSNMMGVNANSLEINPSGIITYVGANSIHKISHGYSNLLTATKSDSTLTTPCTLPSSRAMGVKGFIQGVPGPSDSVSLVVDYGDGTPGVHVNVPYWSMVDSTSATVYGFGYDSSFLPSHLYTYPGTYPSVITMTSLFGCSAMQMHDQIVGSICDTNFKEVGFTALSDSIMTAPCVYPANVRVKLNGVAKGHFSIYDSVYVKFNYSDGTSDYHVVPVDTNFAYTSWDGVPYYTFHYTGYHSYSVPGDYHTDPSIVSNTGTCSSSVSYPHSFIPTVHLDNCGLPGTIVSAVTPTDSSYTACTTPFVAHLNVGGHYAHATDTATGVSYYINFGDGTDSVVHINSATDGYGNYYSTAIISHIYYMTGSYATAITPLDTTLGFSGASVGSPIMVGTSCSPLTGIFYRDGNLNCTPDTLETRLGYWPMAVINNTLSDTTYAWCDTFGHYALTLINGNAYTIIPNYFGPFGLGSDSFVLSCPAASSYSITPTVGGSYTQNFGFTCSGSPTAMDMNISGWGWGFVPGDTGIIGIWSSNAWGYMCDSLSATVTLTIDPLLTYLGMWDGPAPTSISGSTLSWTFATSANILDFHADVKVVTSTGATMGANVCNTLHVTPTALTDSDLTNNTYSWCEPVRSSWDPNEKQVSPKGYGVQGYIPNGTPLSYVVHFQNTGTARARNITINDTISSHLDIGTLQIISSSAPVLVFHPELTGNLVKFRFNDINLPDSNTDLAGSNGYIEYSIVPKEDLPAGTQIVNTAGIYFDYNPAVITNTTLNTIEDTLGAIAGPSSVCAGSSITLSISLPGWMWSSSNGHATVLGGVVTGVSAGVDTISYTAYGHLVVTKIITVNPLPNAGTITGTPAVCEGAVTTLSNVVTGGTWTNGSSSATVTGGVVSGVTAGNSIISYSVTNICGTAVDTMMVTINSLPNAGTITGASTVCEAAVTTLSNIVAGGSWTSGSSSATVVGGVVSGVTTGNSIISYSVTNSCGIAVDTMMVTINPLPVSGTITGTSTVCEAAVTTLSNIVTGGTWTSGSSSATVVGGVVSGVSSGSSIVFYSVTNSCGTAVDTMMVTINPLPNAGTITGTSTVCEAALTTLSNIVTGGTWASGSSSATVVGGVVSGVTAGNSVISYSVTNICGTAVDTMMVIINPLPNAGTITGTPTVCEAAVTTLSNIVTGGTWTSGSSSATVTGGVVSGVTVGNSIISYSVANSCGTAVDTMMVTINPLPNAGTITGTSTVCEAAVTTLGNIVTGGTWTSGSSSATVTGGIVSGVTAGSSIISYSVTNICGTAVDTMMVTINSLPNAGTITGASTLCEAAITTLSNIVTGGSWASGSSSATVIGGVVTGVSSGSSVITYSVTNICGTAVDTMMVTINPLPVSGIITGTASICLGASTTLVSSISGGSWTSSTSAATVSGGIVSGVALGSSVISYDVTNSCGTATDTILVTVYPLPVAGSISGADSVCEGSVIVLSNSIAGGLWSSGDIGIATVSGSSVSGVSAGTVTISYTVTTGCGSADATKSIVVLPASSCNTGIATEASVMISCKLYPNPTNGNITVEIPGATEQAAITIMDIYGKVIVSRTINKQSNLNEAFDLSNLASGTYLIKVDADGKVFRDKVVKW